MISLGLDISATSTGVVVLDAEEKFSAGVPPKVLVEKAIKPKTKGLERCSDVAGGVLEVMALHKLDIITIEGYALGRFSGASIQIVSVGAIVRYFVMQHGHKWLEPSPNELKQFVSGKGNSKKEAMMMHVLEKWGHVSKNNDTADAYGLACMGLAWRGKLKMTGPMSKIIGAMALN